MHSLAWLCKVLVAPLYIIYIWAGGAAYYTYISIIYPQNPVLIIKGPYINLPHGWES